MREILYFLDAKKHRVILQIETRNEKQPYIAITGDVCGHFGQCLSSISPTPTQEKIINFWEQYNLKAEYPQEELDKIIQEIRDEETARWQARAKECIWQIDNDEHEVQIIDHIEFASDCDRDTAIRLYALAKIAEIETVEIADIDIEDDHFFTCQGIEYYVGTEEELNEVAKDYLTDNKSLWQDAVCHNNTELGIEDWVDEVIEMDGFASILNGYDGRYEDVYVESTNEYICVCRR